MTDANGGRLTTHALDLRLGRPAAALRFELYCLTGGERRLVKQGATNSDGRADGPLLEGSALAPGLYEIVFSAGAYQALHLPAGETGFYDVIPIRFKIADRNAHYHVPLLLSPFGYSTYRGS
jgi:5-hydroxyisourate hydrolase